MNEKKPEQPAAVKRHPHDSNPVTVRIRQGGEVTERRGLAGRLAQPPTRPIKFDNPPPLPETVHCSRPLCEKDIPRRNLKNGRYCPFCNYDTTADTAPQPLEGSHG